MDHKEFLINIKELICQFFLKFGHTTNDCWHRFVDDSMHASKGFNKGKALKTAYLANFDGFTSNQGFDEYENISYMPSIYNPTFSAGYYSSFNAYAYGAVFMASLKGTADDG